MARKGMPGQYTRRKPTWPWIAALLAVLIALSSIPAIHAWVIHIDLRVAWASNSILGHNRVLDMCLGLLNSKFGDMGIVLFLLCFFGIHIKRGLTADERARRLAFWIWVSLVFVVFYLGQHMLETFFDRDGPGKALPDWKNLRKLYGWNYKMINSHSYPSGHATAYWVFAFMALRAYRRMGNALLAMAAVLPTTRLITGAHWLSDILLGSIPLAALISALGYETRIARLYYYLLPMAQDVFPSSGKTKRRSLGFRFKAAYRAFMLKDEPPD